MTTLTTDNYFFLFLFLGVQKLVKNAEQVLQVLLAKNFKKSGKQVRPDPDIEMKGKSGAVLSNSAELPIQIISQEIISVKT